MRTLRLSLAGTAILMMLGSLAVGVTAESELGEGVTVEVLSDVGVIPLEAIPEDADHVSYARLSVEPGVSGEVGSAQPQEWASLEYVEEGASSATIAERSRIWRADGTIEDIPAGVASSASAGDTLLSYNGGAAMAFEHGPDEYVSFLVMAGNSRDQADPLVDPPGTEWRLLDYIFPPRATVEAWFSAPIAVTFKRVTLAPGAELMFGVDDIPMLTFVYVEAGRVHRTVRAADIEGAAAGLGGLDYRGGEGFRLEAPAPDRVTVLSDPDSEATVLTIAALEAAEPPAD